MDVARALIGISEATLQREGRMPACALGYRSAPLADLAPSLFVGDIMFHQLPFISRVVIRGVGLSCRIFSKEPSRCRA